MVESKIHFATAAPFVTISEDCASEYVLDDGVVAEMEHHRNFARVSTSTPSFGMRLSRARPVPALGMKTVIFPSGRALFRLPISQPALVRRAKGWKISCSRRDAHVECGRLALTLLERCTGQLTIAQI